MGNVQEWCQDGWGSYSAEPQRDPHVVLTKNTAAVVRGGGASVWFLMRSASRAPAAINRAQAHSGFRVVRTIEPPPKPAFALEFDVNSSVELPASTLDPTQPLTVEGWAVMRQPAANAKDPVVFALDFLRLRVDGNQHWFVSVNADSEQIPTRIFKSDAPISTGRRVHFALAWHGNRVALYLDGQSQKSQAAFAAQHSAQPRYVLRKPPGGFGFEGQLHGVRISRTARYTGAKFEPAESLAADADTLAFYDLQEGQGEVLKDPSGHGRDGKLVGARWVPR